MGFSLARVKTALVRPVRGARVPSAERLPGDFTSRDVGVNFLPETNHNILCLNAGVETSTGVDHSTLEGESFVVGNPWRAGCKAIPATSHRHGCSASDVVAFQ
jgi:hypothetical protein